MMMPEVPIICHKRANVKSRSLFENACRIAAADDLLQRNMIIYERFEHMAWWNKGPWKGLMACGHSGERFMVAQVP